MINVRHIEIAWLKHEQLKRENLKLYIKKISKGFDIAKLRNGKYIMTRPLLRKITMEQDNE